MALDTTSYILGKKAGGGEEPTGTINITSNGITNVKSYATADVNVQPNLESKEITITENTTTLIEPTTGKDGLSSVSITTNVSIPVPVEVESKDVDFYDYDGTRVYSYTRAEVQELTELPANPSHDGLTAQGWNYTLQEIKDYSAKYKYSKVNVGQMYITDDEKTRIYITLQEGRLSPEVGLIVNGSATIDWGDGSTPDTIIGNNWTYVQYVPHTYSSAGDYVIKISGSYDINGGQNIGSYLLYDSTGANNDQKVKYLRYINKIELGKIVNGAQFNSAFENMYNLKSITIPDNTTNPSFSATNLFKNDYNLKCVCWNRNFYFGSSAFQNCYAKIISIPPTILSGNANIFNGCILLESLNYPKISYIGNNGIKNVKFTTISIPETVTTVNLGGISSVCLRYVDFSNHISIPSASGSLGVPSDCQIIVPDALYTDWIATSGWSTYASQIVKASEV